MSKVVDNTKKNHKKLNESEIKISILTIIFNFILFVLKIIVGMLFNSIAVISDAFNSLLDIISSGIIYFSIKVSHKKPDENHQFGHSRAQPIAGLIVAIFTAIFGFELFIASFERLFNGEILKLGLLPLIVMVVVLLTKLFLYLYTKSNLAKKKSLALEAACVDHRNDILISMVVLVGLGIANLGYQFFDSIAGGVVGIYIIKSGFDLGRENIKYIMGEAPDESIFKAIEKQAMRVPGVIRVHDMRAHMLGTDIESEIHICLDKTINLESAHTIGNKVRDSVKKLDDIGNVFVHIDPYSGKFKSTRKFRKEL